MSKGIFVVERKDLVDTLNGLLYAAKRPDVKVSVQYLVNFSVSEENYVHTVIDPWQPLARAAARGLVAQVITKLDAAESTPALAPPETGIIPPETGE